jgi:membrane protease YdiL (CAAX protease family)
LWILAPLSVTLLLRAFGGDGWDDFGLRPNFKGNGFWWLVTLFLFPILITIIVLIGALSGGPVVNGNLISSFVAALLIGFVPSLIKNIFEEFAWRGYLAPKVYSLKMNIWLSHAIVGLIWGAWHLPFLFVFWVYVTPDMLWYFVPLFLVGTFSQAVAYGEIWLATDSLCFPPGSCTPSETTQMPFFSVTLSNLSQVWNFGSPGVERRQHCLDVRCGSLVASATEESCHYNEFVNWRGIMFLRISVFYILTWFLLLLLAGIQQATGLLPPEIGLAQWGPGIAALSMLWIFRKDGHKITFFSKETAVLRYLYAALIPLGVSLVIFLIRSFMAIETSADAPKYGSLLPLLLWMPLGALGEELGWRGYLHKKLATRMSGLFSALLVGILWMPIHVTFLSLGPVFVFFFALLIISYSIVIYAVVQDTDFNAAGSIFHLAITCQPAVYDVI